ncbi:asparaginase [Pseudorhodoferax sp. Leaf274]|uniref:asparaginase n=1 Tax=Pseudorhodoferax sp. Leaf274 TaxID=1736318 RepID=UPI00070260FC|nr:asparaginase [Pseudorhodoferax sp. Leaf274]KQP35220.1 L-asparaginase [Pseudorhodoferax sp. Leaf274]
MQASEAFTGSSRRTLLILGSGGTIAGLAPRPGDTLGYQAAQVGVAQLLAGFDAPPGCELQVEQVAQIDSKDMDAAVWLQLARRCAEGLAHAHVQGIVITHGTDTLEETAYFLQAVLAPSRPVVLACAMRPANAAMPDGPQNLRDALAVAAQPGARGVVAVCAGVVHGAADVRKVHSYRLDAFGSGDAGPLGYVEAGALRQLRAWPQAAPDPGLLGRLPAQPQAWPRVELVFSHAGASGASVDALVRDGVQGLVVAATGNGSVHHALEAALLRAQAAGVRVLRASRCDQGQVMGLPGDALPGAGALSPVKARIQLQLDLLAA